MQVRLARDLVEGEHCHRFLGKNVRNELSLLLMATMLPVGITVIQYRHVFHATDTLQL